MVRNHPCRKDCPDRSAECRLKCPAWLAYVRERDEQYAKPNYDLQFAQYVSSIRLRIVKALNRRKR